MPKKYPLLEESFMSSPIIDMNGYPYFVNPVSDGIPAIRRELLNEVIDGMIDICDLDCDIVLTPEAMGIPLAVGITQRTGIPYAVIRKRSYGLPGEIALDHTNGYSESPMYINGLEDGDRVMVVDDVISTGGTMKAIVDTLRANNVPVTEVAAVYNKSEDVEALAEELGVPIRFLISVSTKDGRPAIR